MDAFLEQRIQYLERLISTKTRSPIIVQLASLYLEAGRPHDALRYCDNAIAHFPYYTTAHLIRAKVLYALEMKAEARREFEFVHSILPDARSVKAMLEQIPPPETETFEEPGQTRPASSSPIEESAVRKKSVDEAQETTERALVEEERPDNRDQLEMDREGGGETRTEVPAEQAEAASEIVEDVLEQDSFGLAPSKEPGAITESPRDQDERAASAPVQQRSDRDNSFGDLGQAEVGAAEAVSSEPLGGTGENYEAFAEAMRGELSGSENTLSLEEFLARQESLPSEPKPIDNFEELAEKLKAAPKITPIIDLTEKKAPPPSEEDTPASTGFVTPTLAEIYAKQGWYDDAIVAFKTLARIKPAERERFEKRIRELEQLKKSEGGGA